MAQAVMIFDSISGKLVQFLCSFYALQHVGHDFKNMMALLSNDVITVDNEVFFHYNERRRYSFIVTRFGILKKICCNI